MYNKFLSVFRVISRTQTTRFTKVHTGTKRSLESARFPMHSFIPFPSITAFLSSLFFLQ